VLKGSERRQRVFAAIYRGKKKAKTVPDLIKATGYSHVVVLQMGGQLDSQQLVHQTKIDGLTAYEKDRFYAAHKAKILQLAKSQKKIESIPTKVRPRTSGQTVTFKLPRSRIQVTEIGFEDFSEFRKALRVKPGSNHIVSETVFKNGIKRLLADSGTFKDWGGEPNDLFTRARIKGKRRTVAFAFKGPGTKGILTPGKLGKNGDQIQRLFKSPAEAFVVQYHGQIAESVLEQMQSEAMLKSYKDEKRIYFGLINGDATKRLLAAYPSAFGLI